MKSLLVFVSLVSLLGNARACCQPVAEPRTDAPHILSFTGSQDVCSPMGHDLCTTFTWQTQNATQVSLESGCIEDGLFYGGGWHFQDDLPANGTGGFTPKINNYAGRLCVVEPVVAGVSVCAVANPQTVEGCQ